MPYYPPPATPHPDLSSHDALGLATQSELDFDRNGLNYGLYGNGVISGCLIVERPTPAMSVEVAVSAGQIIVNGVVYDLVAGQDAAVDAAHPTLPRYDVVVGFSAGIAIQPGTPAADPAIPTLDLLAVDNVVPLAYIYVGPGVTTITNANITNDPVYLRSGGAGTLTAFRTADLAITSDDTVNVDPVLLVPLTGGFDYEFYASLLFTGAQAGDYKARVYAPAGTNTGAYLSFIGNLTSITETALATAGSRPAHLAQVGINTDVSGGVFSVTVPSRLTIEGIIRAQSAVDGNMGISWAQGTSNATATTIKAGSFIRLRPL